MKSRTLSMIAATSIIASGCASTPPAPGANSKKIGEDLYIIQIETVASTVAFRKVWLFDQANAHCTHLGKKVGDTKSNQNKGGMLGDYVLDIEYKCVPK